MCILIVEIFRKKMTMFVVFVVVLGAAAKNIVLLHVVIPSLRKL